MIEKRINLFQLLKQEQKLTKVALFGAQAIENDPREHTKTLNYLQAIYIDAFVRQISPESLRWKYWTNLPQESIEMICEKKYENTLKSAHKIVIDNKNYTVYQDDNKDFGILRRSDYLVVILNRKAYEE